MMVHQITDILNFKIKNTYEKADRFNGNRCVGNCIC